MLQTVSFFEVLKNAGNILRNPLPFHKRNFEKHGDTFRVNLGFGNSVVFTRDAGLAKHMLQQQHRNYHKSPLQSKELARYIGEGLLTANGDKWLKQRRLIQPAFHKKKLEMLISTMQLVIEQELQKIPNDQSIAIYPLMSDLAFKVVAASLFSYKGIDNEIQRLQEITEKAQKTLIKEIRQPYKKIWYYLNGTVRRALKDTKEARAILHQLIEERRKSEEHYDDLLDMLLQARYDDGTDMDNDQLIDEILILFTAGHETTSNALTFTPMLLAQHQDIQEKLFEEQSALKKESLGAMEHIKKSEFTASCIEEAMRLYPPAYFSDRVAIADDRYNELHIKKGTTILISFFEIHRHLNHWDNPEEFNPDRFSDTAKKHADYYFPFGAGPRMCIGSNFAMYEMIMVINSLVSKYQIKTNTNTIAIQPLITLKPKGSQLSFHPRVNVSI
ncbi:cytochrome P450 [Aquimarina brevivitae]|uniref:Cytochrome P450 n=1 Tax=Aquimarina brevivitae TaxID=323412 RepID=A0A4Q7PFC2_9FLAO|nr:cytochrome P450 [Aquimarina brevivitae]RZS98867.1 cytochrome P450 [Aquimarina brevivitae]